jgi:hypothetical protein
MKHRLANYAVAAFSTVGVLSLLFLSTPAAQQRPLSQAEAEKKATPRTPAGHPDMSGFYASFYTGISQADSEEQLTTRLPDGSVFFTYAGANDPQAAAEKMKENQPPYKPEYMAKVKEVASTMWGGNTRLDPQYACKPMGIPRTGVNLMQLVQNDKYLAIMHEAQPGPVFRTVYLDGRKHPADLDSSFLGHSIGRWEGDTLVIDTVGLNDETWLGVTQDGSENLTSLHSDQEHVIERWTRKGDTLTVEITVEDPVMFTRPWVLEPRRTRIAPSNDYIQPQMCVDVNKGLVDPKTTTEEYKCGWCTPASVYGLEEDSPTAVKKK